MPRKGGLRTGPPHKPLVSELRVVRLDGGTKRPHHRRGGHRVPPIHPQVRQGRRLILLAGALLLAALVAIPASGIALAQSPPPDSDNVTLVNRDRQMVERKKEGDFVARPILSRQTDVLFYSIRHPDTGDWLTSTYRVRGGEKQLSEGWEYTFEYPALDEQPELHPEQAYLLVLAVPRIGGGDHHVFHALIPVHQPRGLWDRVLGALDPDRWARAGAVWVIQGVHGTLCGVVEKVAGTEVAECVGE